MVLDEEKYMNKNKNMTFTMKLLRNLSIILFVNLFPLTLFARWPSFVLPTKEQLLQINIFDQSQCSQGYGKIHKGISVRVGTFTNNFCPNDWVWATINETDCIKIQDVNYLNHTIQPTKDENGTTIKTTIQANYGTPAGGLFSIIFVTPENNWSCYEMNSSLHLISCANDS